MYKFNFIVEISVVDNPNQWAIIELRNYKRFHQNAAFIQGHIFRNARLEREIYDLSSCIKTEYAH